VVGLSWFGIHFDNFRKFWHQGRRLLGVVAQDAPGSPGDGGTAWWLRELPRFS